MKHLPLKLSKHPLLIQAFKGDDWEFTTERVWAKDARHDVCVTYGEAITYGYVIKSPAPDLEELLDLAEKVLGLDQEVPKFPQTDAEVWASDIFHNIGYSGDRLTRIAKAIIAVLEERK